MEETIIALILIGIVALPFLAWFILSKKGWCPLFAGLLKWGSILSLICYLVGFLIFWLDRIADTDGILVLTAELLSVLSCASAIIGVPIIWFKNRRTPQAIHDPKVNESPQSTTPSRDFIAFLVAMMVLTVLLTIAIPSFIRSRNTAAQNACINNLRIIDAGKETWAEACRKDAAKEQESTGTNGPPQQ